MTPLEQQKHKQDGVFAKALREASNAFVQMGGHPRTLLHHARRSHLIEQAIEKLHILKREGDAYHQLGQQASSTDSTLANDDKPVGFYKTVDSSVTMSELMDEANKAGALETEGLSLAISNPYKQTVKYSSSNESVATVDEKTGVITPIANGEVTIKVAFSKKGEYPRVEDSFDLVIEDIPSSDSEPQ